MDQSDLWSVILNETVSYSYWSARTSRAGPALEHPPARLAGRDFGHPSFPKGRRCVLRTATPRSIEQTLYIGGAAWTHVARPPASEPGDGMDGHWVVERESNPECWRFVDACRDLPGVVDLRKPWRSATVSPAFEVS